MIRKFAAVVFAFVFLVFAVTVFAGGILSGCSRDPSKASPHVEHKETQYQCPMHPEIIQDRPGECPICGMDLVPVKKLSAGKEIPGNAEEKEALLSGERKILFYRNPMDPDITSKVPAKDEMGMDYIPVYSDEEAQPPGVKGHAQVSLGEEGIRQAGIRTLQAGYGTLSRTINTYGSVIQDETKVFRVNTKISGWIERLYVNFTYQKVMKGQAIVSIYSPELLSSQKEYIEAIKTYEEVSGAEAKSSALKIMKSAKKRLELFDVPEGVISELEKTGKPSRSVVLVSPADGYVTVKNVIRGQKIDAGTEIFTIADLSSLWIEAAVYANEIPFVGIGQKSEIILPHDQGKVIKTRVAYIDPVINAESRTLRLRFDADASSADLKPGMFADVRIEVEPQKGIIIPDSAIIDTGTRKIVYVETSPGLFTPREVVTGLRSNGRAIILSGIEPGEAVAVKGNFLLDSESRIRWAISTASRQTVHEH